MDVASVEQIKGLAPIAGWVDDSPNISPDKNVTSVDISSFGIPSPTASSGLGPDRSTSTSSTHYSSAVSSIICKPLFSSTASILQNSDSSLNKKSLSSIVQSLDSSSNTRSNASVLDKSNNSLDIKPPFYPGVQPIHTSETKLNNGYINIPHKTFKSIVINEKPVYEGVKFKDDFETEDSICSSDNDEDSEEEEDSRKPKVPDGGWGWVVVAASFFISTIADGISFSFGLLYGEFLIHFGESKSTTAWIGSLFMAVPLLSGPIGSALVDRYGCRVMTIIGGIIAGVGFIMSCFAESILVLYLTFGVVAGLGLGLCYVTAVVSIAYWFDKRRGLAMSFGACGTGIGTFIYAPMTQYFIEEYGWRGSILLLAGTLFNMCACGAVMRDPEWWTLEQSQESTFGDSKRASVSTCGTLQGLEGGGVEEMRKMLKSGVKPEYVLTKLATSTAGSEVEDGNKNVTLAFRSVVNLPTFVRQNETVPLEVLESLSANHRVFNMVLENYPSLLMCRSLSDSSKINNFSHEPTVSVPVPVVMSMKVQVTTNPLDTGAGEHLLRNDKPTAKKSSLKKRAPHQMDSHKRLQTCGFIQPVHYLKDIRVHRNSVMYRGAILNLNKYRLRASSCPDIYRNSMTTIAKETEEEWYDDILELLKGMVDFSMFLELHFLLMSLSTILLFVWFIVPYFYLAEHVKQHGYTEQQASFILSVIGIANFVGILLSRTSETQFTPSWSVHLFSSNDQLGGICLTLERLKEAETAVPAKVGLGWAGDQKWMNVTKTYSGCLVMCGLATLAIPVFTDNFALLTASSAMFGLFFASSFSFTPVILVQLVPLERFTTAYGLILLCAGIGNLVGPPLAGTDEHELLSYIRYHADVGLVILHGRSVDRRSRGACGLYTYYSEPQDMGIWPHGDRPEQLRLRP
uniref:Monocarboxylate transporter 14 n=1 Tax=Timema cristinae TaxID=61476 RepID=A0A7R9CFQ9_TIMCR|nr:unnamed protein product [Timema cristinae]